VRIRQVAVKLYEIKFMEAWPRG